ncbi:MAG: DMT family transporter, partial [Eubacterium sp.]
EMIPKETSEPLTVNLKEEATPIQEDICIEKDVCIKEDVCAEEDVCIKEDVCVEEEHYDFDVPVTPRVDNHALSAAEKLPDEAEEIVDDSDYDRWAPTRNSFKSSPIGTALKRKSKKNAEPKADCDPIKNTIAPSETTEIEIEDLPATQASTQNPVDETLQEDLLQDDSTQESLFEEDENEENIDVVEESTLEPAEIKMPKSTIVPKAARENFNNDPLFGVPSTEHDEKRFKSFFDEFDHHKDDDFLKDFDLEDDETANADPAPSFYNPVDTSESSETETNLSDKKYDAIFQDDDDLDDSDLLDDEEFYFDDEDAFPDEDDDDQETFQEIITNTDLNEDSKEIYSDNNLDDVTYENVEAVDLGAYKFSAVAVRLSLFIFTMLALGVFTSLSGGTFINLDYLVLFILCIGIALTIDMSFNATLISSVVLMLVFFIGTLFTYFTSKEPLSLYHMLWLIIIPLSMCSASALVQKVKEIILANQLLNEELDQLYSDDDPEEAPIEKSSDLPIEEDAATEIKDQQESL